MNGIKRVIVCVVLSVVYFWWRLFLSLHIIKKRDSVDVRIFYKHSVLLVRHSYGPHRWCIPGGGIQREEHPDTSAQREIF